MKKLVVRYAGWGEDWPLGTLADDGRTLLFEYNEEALQQGLELSPLALKLSLQAYGGFPEFQMRLPGLIADSLPDGWGLLLMDRLCRQGNWQSPSPLDRLAFIGDRAMGALRFIPPAAIDLPLADLTLLDLARESARVLAGDASAVLRELVIIGGSPQGARPKSLVQYDASTNVVSTRPDAPGVPWIVKFQGQGEHKEACAIEALYATMARACGLSIPDTRLFDLTPKLAAFSMARFDREDGLRVPIHSLAGLLNIDFRMPGSCDYTGLLRATRFITRDEREVAVAFGRAVFNVVFHNRDDHPKNFAFRLDRDRRWRLAPAFDLTFSDGPGGQHHMDVCGKVDAVTRTDLLHIAGAGGISNIAASQVIDRIAESAGTFAGAADAFPIRRATLNCIQSAIEAARVRLI